MCEGETAAGVADGIDARDCLHLRAGRRATVVRRGTVLAIGPPRQGPGHGLA